MCSVFVHLQNDETDAVAPAVVRSTRPRIEDKLGRHSDTELENGFASPEAAVSNGPERPTNSPLSAARRCLEVNY